MSVLTNGPGRPAGDPAGYISPFGTTPTSLVAEAADSAEDGQTWRENVLQSPFAEGLAAADEGGIEIEALSEVLDHLADEDFTDALEDLIDEAAARHLTDRGAWSVPPTAAEAEAMLAEWLEPLAREAERSLDTLNERLAGSDLMAMPDRELEELLEAAAVPPSLGNESFDQFLGGLVKKAKQAVSGAVSLAKKGIALAGKLTPVGLVLGRLKGLIRPLLKRVLATAIAKLPEAVRPIARAVAGKLGPPPGHAPATTQSLADTLDEEIATFLLEPGGAAATEFEDEAGAAAANAKPVDELDAARARLAQQLVEVPPGTAPVAEIEEFVPAVLAVKPLIKLGISIIGRDRVVNFVAKGIASLIQGMVGPTAAAKLSRPLVDVGLRALGFEVSPSTVQELPGEALAQTVEGTVLRLLEMPVETFSDELQLGAALQDAFAESAAAFMPDRMLHAELPQRETAQEGGVWLLMPRGARPHYRYRRYSKVFTIPVTRQVARAVPWSDGGTLESYLLDQGAESWPVVAEVDLYEAMPGTRLGHLTQGEAGPDQLADPVQFQALTPEIAGLLLREPAMGRRPAPRAHPRRPQVGQRVFRVRPVGPRTRRRVRRPRRRVVLWFNSSASSPRLAVVLRLTERQAQQVLDQLEPATKGARRDLTGVLKTLREHYRRALPDAVAERLLRGPGEAAGAAKAAGETAGAASAPADAAPDAGATADAAATPAPDGNGSSATEPAARKLSAAVSSALSTFLTQRATAFAAAVRDPADGITVKVTFPGVTRQSLSGDLPPGEVTVRPGWPRRD